MLYYIALQWWFMWCSVDALSSHLRRQIERFQEKAQRELQIYDLNVYPDQTDRTGRLLLRLPALRQLSPTIMEELFFTGLIGNVEIDSIIPYILRLDTTDYNVLMKGNNSQSTFLNLSQSDTAASAKGQTTQAPSVVMVPNVLSDQDSEMLIWWTRTGALRPKASRLLNCALRYGLRTYVLLKSRSSCYCSSVDSFQNARPFDCLIWIVTVLTRLAVAAANVSFYNQIGIGVSCIKGKSINFSKTAKLWLISRLYLYIAEMATI